MRILLVTADYPPMLNGVGDYTARLAGELAAAGADVAVLTDTLADEHKGVEVIRPFGDWSEATAARLAAVADTSDVAHIQMPGVAWGRSMAPLFLPSRRRGATVATFHEWRSMRCRWRLRASLVTRGLTAAVTVDAGDAPPLCRAARVVRVGRRLPTTTIGIGSNIPVLPPDRRARRRELGLDDDDVAVAFFGLLYPHKGVGDLLDAAAGTRLRPVVIGDFDRADDFSRSMRPRLEREAVWVRGADAEAVSRTLGACDLAALPYGSGAGPNRSALLAAMQHGLATVTTDGPTTPADFLATPGLAFVPPRSPDPLRKALLNLADNEGRRRAAGDAARAWADRLSWPAIARAHLDLYHHVLDR